MCDFFLTLAGQLLDTDTPRPLLPYPVLSDLVHVLPHTVCTQQMRAFLVLSLAALATARSHSARKTQYAGQFNENLCYEYITSAASCVNNVAAAASPYNNIPPVTECCGYAPAIAENCGVGNDIFALIDVVLAVSNAQTTMTALQLLTVCPSSACARERARACLSCVFDYLDVWLMSPCCVSSVRKRGGQDQLPSCGEHAITCIQQGPAGGCCDTPDGGYSIIQQQMNACFPGSQQPNGGDFNAYLATFPQPYSGPACPREFESLSCAQ